MTPKFVLGMAIVGMASVPLLRGQSTNPVSDPSALLKELNTLEVQSQQVSASHLEGLATQIESNTSSAPAMVQFYAEAVHHNEFGAPGDAGRFEEWKRQHKDLLENKAFQAALALHLRYLVITLRAAAKPGDLSTLTPLKPYISDLAAAELAGTLSGGNQGGGNQGGGRGRGWGGGGGRGGDEDNPTNGLLQAPLSQGEIARALAVGATLDRWTGPADTDETKWQPTAGDWRKILDLDIRKPLRKKKNLTLLQTWPFQIELETAAAKGSLPPSDLAKLQWNQASDMVVLGQTDAAIAEMLRIVKSDPQDATAAGWIDQLKILLQSKMPGAHAPATSVPPVAPPPAGTAAGSAAVTPGT